MAAGLVSPAATLIFANFVKMKSGDPDPGMTTEVAALLLFGLGALIVYGTMQAAVVMGGAMAVLLHLKDPLDRFTGRVGDRDMRAMMQFVVLSLVILPVLPNKGFGPYEVWNPFKIWLMVVLIVGISLGGYVAYKLFGAKAGALLGGVIGGLISSTATTVSFARRSASSEAAVPLAALVIMIAACISFARVVAEVAVVAPGNFLKIAPPLIVMFVVTCGISAALYFMVRKQQAKLPEQKNPAELKSALVFSGMYALVLFAVAFGVGALRRCRALHRGRHLRPDRHGCHHAFRCADDELGAFTDDGVEGDPAGFDGELSLQVRHRGFAGACEAEVARGCGVWCCFGGKRGLAGALAG